VVVIGVYPRGQAALAEGSRKKNREITTQTGTMDVFIR